MRFLFFSYAETPIKIYDGLKRAVGLLSGKLPPRFMKDEGGSSVEVSSSAGSVFPYNVSVPTL